MLCNVVYFSLFSRFPPPWKSQFLIPLPVHFRLLFSRNPAPCTPPPNTHIHHPFEESELHAYWFLLRDLYFRGGCGYGSESEGEDPADSRVMLPQNVPGRGNVKSQQSAIRLTEVTLLTGLLLWNLTKPRRRRQLELRFKKVYLAKQWPFMYVILLTTFRCRLGCKTAKWNDQIQRFLENVKTQQWFFIFLS